jgi:hypothetical protein
MKTMYRMPLSRSLYLIRYLLLDSCIGIAPNRRHRCDDALSVGSVECGVAEVQIECAPARATTGGGRTPFAFGA